MAQKIPFKSYDLTLPTWGPYTKKYSGVSHIPDANDGVRFDLAVFPGYYRRRVDVPNVTFESGYHSWSATPNLSCYTMRHELEWKDRVYNLLQNIRFRSQGIRTKGLLHIVLVERAGTIFEIERIIE